MATLQESAAAVQTAQAQVDMIQQQLASGRAMFDQQTGTIKDMLAKQEASYEASAKPLNDQLVAARSQLYDALRALEQSASELLAKPVHVIVDGNGDGASVVSKCPCNGNGSVKVSVADSTVEVSASGK